MLSKWVCVTIIYTCYTYNMVSHFDPFSFCLVVKMCWQHLWFSTGEKSAQIPSTMLQEKYHHQTLLSLNFNYNLWGLMHSSQTLFVVCVMCKNSIHTVVILKKKKLTVLEVRLNNLQK